MDIFIARSIKHRFRRSSPDQDHGAWLCSAPTAMPTLAAFPSIEVPPGRFKDKFGETPAKTFGQTTVRFLKHYLGQTDYGFQDAPHRLLMHDFGGKVPAIITTDAVDEGLSTHHVMNTGKTKLRMRGAKNRYIGTMLNMCVTGHMA